VFHGLQIANKKAYLGEMKSHNGMRPQDVVILLKILTVKVPDWQYRDLASDLFLSISEISESLQRSRIAGLIDDSRRNVFKQSLAEFIEHGLRYVFPQIPGTLVSGAPTAHSHKFFRDSFPPQLEYVWPDDNGSRRGLSITPLYKGVTKAIRKDEDLYLLLAAVDVIRVGRAREIKMAIEVLHKYIIGK